MKRTFCLNFVLACSAALLAGCHSAATTADKAEYISPEACADCHGSIAASYSRTAMARGFDTPRASNTPTNNDYFDQTTNTHYQVVARGKDFIQRRYQTGPDGREANVDERKIDYVLGSGNHSRTYLQRTARNTLLELPLAWYPQSGGQWAINHSALRAVSYECMFCHNAYPKVPERSEEPIYNGQLPTGIDCQRCHGPGSQHVRAARTGARFLAGTIVNPRRLTPERQMEVCMQCHLQTTSQPLPASVRRFWREPFSYSPAEALEDFQLYFDRAGGPQPDGRFEIVSSAYRLRQSQCFLKSAGKLVCETCHNPHDIPHGEEAIQHYDNICRTCHGAAIEAVVAKGKHAATSDCATCHMPKRRADDVPLATITDHLIQRPKPFPKPVVETVYRGEVVPYYPAQVGKDDGLIVAAAQVIDASNLSVGLPRFADAVSNVSPAAAAYIVLGDAWRASGKPAQAAQAYEQAVKKDPASSRALRSWGVALKESGDKVRAAQTLQSAVRQMPKDPKNWYELGLLDSEQGRNSQAISELKKAVQLDPDFAAALSEVKRINPSH